MKKIELKAVIQEYDSLETLPQVYKDLVFMAKKATHASYAPYSKFHVGAAVLLKNGVIVSGSNQENVAYPSGLCAERVAVFTASTQHPGVPIESIAITAESNEFDVNFPITPCGACRQVLSEYEGLFGNKIKIILSGNSGKVLVIEKVEDLLPLSFKADQLRK